MHCPTMSGQKWLHDSNGCDRAALRVTLCYALFGALWILVSDQILALLLQDPHRIVLVSMYKGWGFVAVTSLLLYGLVHSATARLGAREAYYRTLLDHLPQLIWQKDRNSVFVSCNAAHAKALGGTARELAGKSDHDFYPADLAEKYRADDCRIMEQGRVETYDERWLVDGQERVVHTSKIPLRDGQGNPFGILGIAEDITERKRIEEEHRHLGEALRQSTAAILMADLQARITYGNPAFCRLFGYEESELPTLSVTNLCPPDPDSRRQQQELFAQLRASGSWSGELVRLTRDGEPLQLHATIGAVCDPDGTVRGFVGSYLDLRPLKAKEEALRQQYNTLERFSRVSVGRELDMIQLKQQVNALSVQLGQDPPYPLEFMNPPAGGAKREETP